MNTPVSTLTDMGACSDAREWVRANKHTSLESAWLACDRGDWMLWYAGKKSGEPESPERKRLVLAACECAREVLPIFEKRYPDDKRVRECIETVEQWARGQNGVTIEMVRAKRSAYAYASAYAAYAADAAYAAAAYASAYAAYAADAAYAAAAADAAYAAADAAYAARIAMHKRCAEIVRRHYPTLP